MNIQQLAVEMNMPEADVTSFINCLRVWTDKGYSIEDAIAKNLEQVTRMMYACHNAPTEGKKAIVVDTFFPT